MAVSNEKRAAEQPLDELECLLEMVEYQFGAETETETIAINNYELKKQSSLIDEIKVAFRVPFGRRAVNLSTACKSKTETSCMGCYAFVCI